jgi:hypothetical protein
MKNLPKHCPIQSIDLKHKLRNEWGSCISFICFQLGISVSILDDVIIEDIVLATLPVMSDDDAIRALYARFASRNYTQSHLAVLFQIPKPRVCEFVHNPLLGKRPRGPERILSETEELAVLNYVQECQKGFNCVEPKELTAFVRNMISESPYLNPKIFA